ncbi:hypothetical protein [Nonomuraea recticatena]|uniref:hypothetical protein n=1 Tax=Nonomuraea recticatena TaxID=46178 RepID=UPI0036079779
MSPTPACRTASASLSGTGRAVKTDSEPRLAAARSRSAASRPSVPRHALGVARARSSGLAGPEDSSSSSLIVARPSSTITTRPVREVIQRSCTLPEKASPTALSLRGMRSCGLASSSPSGRASPTSSRLVAASGRRPARGTTSVRSPSSPAWWASTAHSICSGDSTQATDSCSLTTRATVGRPPEASANSE